MQLSAEIDRTLKKVAEGVELFESIYDKMQASTNQTQKEKSELDLKTQIKKLQRLRDQIKTWVASNDIKDKSALLENRRLIETVSLVHIPTYYKHAVACKHAYQGRHRPRVVLFRHADSGLHINRYCFTFLMFLSARLVRNFLFDSLAWVGVRTYLYRRDEQQMEKFKACEKEMKTKAFSKEGLIQAAKLDPKEQEKEEAMQWVNHQVEELQMQVESTEAEVEALQGAGKKRNKGSSSNAGRLEQLEHLNERRKWHIGRLEIVLRMLNNGSLPLEKMGELKEDVGYFVDGNTVCIAFTIHGIDLTQLVITGREFRRR